MMDPAFAEALSEIEQDFFRGGDALEASSPFETWDELESRVHQVNDEDEWEWAIAIARARSSTRASTVH